MKSSIVFWAFVIIAGVWSAFLDRLLLSRFLTRGCMGREWRLRFPNTGKLAIRRFLGVFLAAFALPRKHKLKFSPDDKVMDVYRALYPIRWMPDQLELETFEEALRKEYALDLNKGDNEDITLGDIFARIPLAL